MFLERPACVATLDLTAFDWSIAKAREPSTQA
jgi:hypothetical protein